jgi:acyl-CoA thioesterase FadM
MPPSSPTGFKVLVGAAACEVGLPGREYGLRAAESPRPPHRDAERPRFVTASLHVDDLRPTPLGPELEIRGRATDVKGRKVVVEARVLANGEVTARGVVIAVRIPEGMPARG